jgi:DNA-binding MarR family transcriptional regulator
MMRNSAVTSELVLIALRQIIRAIDLHSKKLIKQYGLTGPQLIVLKEIERKEKISLTALAKNVSLSLPTVSSLLDRLEKQQYIQRVRGEVDKRTFYALITETGKKAIEKSPNLLQEQFLQKFEKLEAWEQHLLVSSIQRIAAMMNAESVEALPYLEGI